MPRPVAPVTYIVFASGENRAPMAPAASGSLPTTLTLSDLKPCALAVGPEQVVQPVDGWLAADGCVSAAMVVGPKPAIKGCGAVSVAAVERAVGPAGEHGADEALCLAVGLWASRPGAQVSDAQAAAGDRVDG